MINRRELLAGALPLAGPFARSRRPNFILIVLDDLGCTDLGCYGARDLKTPHIDAIAASGIRFTNWYSNAPVCAPARAALLSGRYPARAGVPDNGGVLRNDIPTITSLLRQNGYATGLVGKWHLGTPEDGAPNDREFDEFFGFHSGCVDYYSHRYYWGEPRVPNFHDLYRNRTEVFADGQYLTERLGEEAAGFVRRNRQKPFFLYLAFNAPHYPMHAPAKYLQRFAGLETERAIYAAMISAVDDQVGRMMEELRTHQLTNDTCVFLAGDNGATTEARAGSNGKPATAGSNGPYRGYKFSLFDGGTHVPGMMSFPGIIPSGRTTAEIVMSMDVLPTIAQLASVPLPERHGIDGRDLFDVVSANGKSPHEAIFWAQGKQLAVRRGKWKLVINGVAADGTTEGSKPLRGDDAMFLSDLDADPGETRNLRRDRPDLLDELATLAQKFKQRLPAGPL
jgi:arylsulfatase A-like enzyme